jgi:hypothetical protein
MHTLFSRWSRLALLTLPLAVACGSDSTFDPNRDLKLRIVNASTAAGGPAELLLDEQSAGLLAYGQSTPYFTAPGGGHTITMRDEPTDGVPGPVLFTTNVTLSAGEFQTVIVTGSASDLAAITATEQSEAGDGTFLLRVIHAGPTTPSLDLYLNAQGTDINTVTPLISGIDPREVTDYQTVPVGSYQVRLTTSGTKDVLISANSLSIQSGQVATILVLDNPTAGGAPAAFVVPDGGDLNP